MTRKLTQLRGVDPFADRMQSQVSRTLDSVNAPGSIGGGRLIEDVELTASAQEITHQLGRKWAGAFIVKSSAVVSMAASASRDDARFLTVTGSGAATVSLWVF